MKFAFYEKDITPPLHCTMPGYGKIRPALTVYDKLFVKAFTVSDGDNTLAMLVFDACWIPKKLCDSICDGIYRRHGIPTKNVMIVANHSHTGIPINEVPADGCDYEYMHYIERLAVDCVTLALEKMTDASLSYGRGLVDGISFCRNYKMTNGNVRTHGKYGDPTLVGHYREPDKTLSILFVKDNNDNPIGAIVNFACHQDCVAMEGFTGDFSSEISYKLKEKYGPEFVSFFIAGASGDINHLDAMNPKPEPTDLPHYRMMGRKIAAEAIDVIENKLEPVKDGKVVGLYNELEIEHREYVEGMKEYLAERSTSGPIWLQRYLDTNKEKIHKTPVGAFIFGDVALFGMPGEMFNQFQLDIEAVHGNNYKCLYSTHYNGQHGYVPTKDLMDTDIYEARLCGSSFLAKDAGERITKALIELIK